MALTLPETATELDQRSRVDVSRELTGSNPFLQNSWLGALISAAANRNFDFYLALRQAELEGIPDTAELRLEQWAAIWDILKQPAVVASGRIVATNSSVGGVILIGTVWVSSDGSQYETMEAGTIVSQVLSVDTLTFLGGIATLTTNNDHMLGSNVLITVAGAVETEYNGSGLIVTVTGPKTLTYAVAGSPSTPATGTITLTAKYVSLSVQSIGFGLDQNQLADAPLTLQAPITDVDNEANVDASTLGNGADQELDAALKLRFIERIQNPIAHFNEAEITAVSKAVAGVTRVFVQEITPAVGQVTVYFMRDNDTSPIPDASEVALVKAAIDAIKPANTDTLDVVVVAPTPVSSDFTFTALSPDTPTMRTAITNSLEAFYAERVDVDTAIVEEAYNAAIFNTVDLITGDELSSFTLTAPPGDIAIAAGQIGILGNVNFPV